METGEGSGSKKGMYNFISASAFAFLFAFAFADYAVNPPLQKDSSAAVIICMASWKKSSQSEEMQDRDCFAQGLPAQ